MGPVLTIGCAFVGAFGALALMLVVCQQGTFGDMAAKAADNIKTRMAKKQAAFTSGSPSWKISVSDWISTALHTGWLGALAAIAAGVHWLIGEFGGKVGQIDQSTYIGILCFGIASTILKAAELFIKDTQKK